MEVLTILTTVCIFVIGMGLGVTVSLKDFQHAIKMPKAVGTGFLSQIVFMPFMAFLLAVMLDVTDLQATGLVLIGCAPGGGLSNLFCLWCGGDVSLSITMTTMSTLAASFSIPLNLWIYLDQAMNIGDSIEMDWASLFGSLGIILAGTGTGMLIGYNYDNNVRKKVETAGSVTGLLVLAAAFVVGIAENHELIFEQSWKVWLGSFVLQPLGLLFGYAVAKYMMGFNEKLSRTICLETGLQNAALIIGMITLTFDGEQRDECLVFPYIFSLAYIFWTALIIILFRYNFITRLEEEVAEMNGENMEQVDRDL